MPKLYLRGFASEKDQLVRVPLGGTAHLQSINDATVRKDYYTVNRDGVEPDEFERTLGLIETDFAPILRSVLNESNWPLNPKDRRKFATWIALQHLRGESIRNSGEEVYRAASKLEVGVSSAAQIREKFGLGESFTDEQVEDIRAELLATADTFDVDHHQHLALVMEMLPGMANVVFHRQPWLLIEFERKRLGTSDTPVALVPGELNKRSGVGLALGTAGELLVPLDRRRLLVLGELGDDKDDVRSRGTAQMANTANAHIAAGARKAVYHHPDDAPFKLVKIPDKPRTSEMRISDIDGLIESFAKLQGRPSRLPKSDSIDTSSTTPQP